jgi:hypothetical protein
VFILILIINILLVDIKKLLHEAFTGGGNARQWQDALSFRLVRPAGVVVQGGCRVLRPSPEQDGGLQ